MSRSMPFFPLKTFVFRGTGSTNRYFSQTFEMTGLVKLEVQFQVFKETGTPAAAASIAFSQDGINFDQASPLTEGAAQNEITSSAMYRFAKAFIESTDGNIATFHILARGLTN